MTSNGQAYNGLVFTRAERAQRTREPPRRCAVGRRVIRPFQSCDTPLQNTRHLRLSERCRHAHWGGIGSDRDVAQTINRCPNDTASRTLDNRSEFIRESRLSRGVNAVDRHSWMVQRNLENHGCQLSEARRSCHVTRVLSLLSVWSSHTSLCSRYRLLTLQPSARVSERSPLCISSCVVLLPPESHRHRRRQ